MLLTSSLTPLWFKGNGVPTLLLYKSRIFAVFSLPRVFCGAGTSDRVTAVSPGVRSSLSRWASPGAAPGVLGPPILICLFQGCQKRFFGVFLFVF